MLPTLLFKSFTFKRNSPGNIELKARVIFKRKSSDFKTGIVLPKNQWDDAGQCSTNYYVNKRLEEIRSQVEFNFKELTRLGMNVSAKSIKDQLTRPEITNPYVVDFWQDFIDGLLARGEVKASSHEKKQSTINLFIRFCEEYKLGRLRIKDMTEEVVDQYIEFVKTTKSKQFKKRFEPDTIVKHLQRLKTILEYAKHKRFLERNPFFGRKITKPHPKPCFLTQEELNRIIELPLSEFNVLRHSKIVFLFSVYSALRFSDAMKLTFNDYKYNSRHKEHYFYLEQEKTGEMIYIPVLPPLQKIIEERKAEIQLDSRFSLSEEELLNTPILPRLANATVNRHLKDIAKLCKIDLKLTHKVARHTCGTTILLDNNVPLDVVQKWMGHSNIKTTQIYARTTHHRISREAKRLYGVLQ